MLVSCFGIAIPIAWMASRIGMTRLDMLSPYSLISITMRQNY